MVSNIQDVFNSINENKVKLKDLGVSRLGVFGSFTENNQNLDSDVDLLVEFSKGKKNYRNFINTANLVESILERRIDLLTPESLSKYIGPHIIKSTQYVQIA